MTVARVEPEENQTTGRMPVIFAAHGAPVLLDDAAWMAELAAWANAMPKPSSILMVSAHWEQRPTALGATRTVPLVYDFYGFADRYYRTEYPAPGAPELATRVRELLRRRDMAFTDEPERGLDHGAYVPLVAMYPGADVPVLQISMPRLDPQELFALGQALGPLRDGGVLVFGSGFLTHNMRYAFRPGIPAWARDVRRLGGGRVVTLRRRRPVGLPPPRPGGADGFADLGALCPGARRRGRGRGRPPCNDVPDYRLLDGRGVHEAIGPVRLTSVVQGGVGSANRPMESR